LGQSTLLRLQSYYKSKERRLFAVGGREDDPQAPWQRNPKPFAITATAWARTVFPLTNLSFGDEAPLLRGDSCPFSLAEAPL
jgi:hypothetical protein